MKAYKFMDIWESLTGESEYELCDQDLPLGHQGKGRFVFLITDIPEEIHHRDVIKAFCATKDMTGFMGRKRRAEFCFHELGPGKFIH